MAIVEDVAPTRDKASLSDRTVRAGGTFKQHRKVSKPGTLDVGNSARNEISLRV